MIFIKVCVCVPRPRKKESNTKKERNAEEERPPTKEQKQYSALTASTDHFQSRSTARTFNTEKYRRKKLIKKSDYLEVKARPGKAHDGKSSFNY